MAMVTVNDSNLYDIADSIRAKLGVQTTYKPSQMADAIDSIGGGGITPTGTKEITITENGTTTEDVTNYANAEIIVDVPTGGITPSGTKYITYLGIVNVAGYEYIKNGKIPVNESDWSLSEAVMAYPYCLLMKISNNYYLLLSDNPLFIYIDGANYYEAGAVGFKRSQGSSNTFSTVGNLTISETIGTFDGVTYGILGNARTLSQFIWANHDIKQWGTDTVLIQGE